MLYRKLKTDPDDKDTTDLSILRLASDEFKFTDEDDDVYEFVKQD